MGRPKALARVRGVPLVGRVVSAARDVAGEVVVASRGALAVDVERILPGVRVVRDRHRARTPLAGLLAGAEALDCPYMAALPCDLPFVRPLLLARLFRAAEGRDAAIPRWPDGRIEPLVAVYRREALVVAARASLAAGERSILAMIRRLDRVRFVPIRALRSADPAGVSFVNLNTPGELARARRFGPAARRDGRPRGR
jgi:molybdopterin-guanine dinucleotide biosynthesis protein A